MTPSVSDAQLHAFFDGQLSDEEEAEVLVYLEAHPEALRRFRTHDAQRHVLATGIDGSAGDDVDPATEALAARLAARLHRREWRTRLRRWLGAGAAAVALIASGWLGHIAYVGTPDAEMPALLADAARDHVLFARASKPVEIAGTDQSLMREIFSRHLGEDVQIPDLGAHGYELIGGRLLGAAEGPFVQLLYDDGENHPLTLYVAKHNVPGAETRFTEIDGRGAGYWKQQALSYALIADAPIAQVQQIAAGLTDTR